MKNEKRRTQKSKESEIRIYNKKLKKIKRLKEDHEISNNNMKQKERKKKIKRRIRNEQL